MRTLLLLLLLANGAVFAWTHGWLEPAVPAPGQAEREPARLVAQVNADAVRILPPGAAGDATARQAPPRCVEAGPFGLVDATAAEAALEAADLPAGVWERDLRGPTQVWLRVPHADTALRERLQTIAASSAPLAGGFKACATAP